MSSIIEGYNYDIFISYRQKDNKYDGWVTEFVDHLKRELEATFKEEVSVYFDINPSDYLLESYEVDASLKDKLKCLIFVPIISRTYCDHRSFAWEHEFKAFVEQVSQDQFGLKVKLPNGNVASRILPVRIYDLDTSDIKLCESVLGGVLRGVEFIYKEPGVNRPLKPDDDEKINLNKTKYRNQINKVGNAIKEIITALGQHEQKPEEVSRKVFKPPSIPLKSHNTKIVVGSVIVIALILLGLFFIPKLFKSSVPVEKSIAVLPFDNLSNEPGQEYISDGMMQEILNHLFKIGGLKIPSSTSSMRFKGSKLSVREMARELGVSFILEGNVARSGDNIRIIVSLSNGKDGSLIWTEDYKKTMTAINLLEIESDVAQQVAENMKIVINPDVKKRIETKPTNNTEAYTLFLQVWNSMDLSFDQARSMLERAIILDPGYADAYALLAMQWIYSGAHAGNISREQVLEKAESLLKRALQLDNNSLLAHFATASLRLFYYWDFESVEKEFQISNQLDPSNSETRWTGLFSDYLLATGKYREAFILTKNDLDKNKNSSFNWMQMALAYYFDGQQEKALETIETARHLSSDDEFTFTNSIRLMVYMAKYEKAIEIFEKSMAEKQLYDLMPYHLGHLAIAYFKAGNKSKSTAFLNELLTRSKTSPIGSPSFFAAAIYTAMGENEQALQLLEKAFADHEVEMYWLKVEPLFRPLHGDPQFENLLAKIGFK